MDKKNRQFKHEVRMRICAILDYSREYGGLSIDQERELQRLRGLLESNRLSKPKNIFETLPFHFDFKTFTVENYRELREAGYKVEEIRKMCGVGRTTFFTWRAECDLLERSKKQKSISNEDDFPFIFDFSTFTVDEYQNLRKLGYTPLQIRKMCSGASHKEFIEWREKNGLIKKRMHKI
ncbi:TPA: hypothetical protein ACF1UY_001761 [Enterococcus hirae]